MSRVYSVVIAAFNADSTIDGCLRSVAEQSLVPYEVIVVNDDSRDGTEDTVCRCKRYLSESGIRLVYFRLPCNSGPSAARNKGIREAKGDYIAFLDADDIWSRDKLAIIDRFIGDSSIGMVCHPYTEIRASVGIADPARYEVRQLSRFRMLFRNPAQTSCVVARKRSALMFDERMRYCEDHDLWMRIAEDSAVIGLVGEPLTYLARPQLSGGGLSASTTRMRIGEMRVYYNFCGRAWLRRGWFLPGLVVFSLLKHVYSWLRRLVFRKASHARY